MGIRSHRMVVDITSLVKIPSYKYFVDISVWLVCVVIAFSGSILLAAVLFLTIKVITLVIINYLRRAKLKALPTLGDFYLPPATRPKGQLRRWLRIRPLMFMCLGIFLGLMPVVNVFSFVILGFYFYEVFLPPPLARSSILIPIIWSIAAVCISCAERYANPKAHEALKIDSRPPILILRSFAEEESFDPLFQDLLFKYVDFNNLETLLMSQLSKYGSTIALHKSGRKLPFSNIATELVNSETWKEKFLSYLDKAGMIVIIVGVTPGLLWEMEQVTTRGLLPRTILILPTYFRVKDDGTWSIFLRKLPKGMRLNRLKDLHVGNTILVRWSTKGDMLVLQSKLRKKDESCTALALYHCLRMTGVEKT
jgi:hypothetical protein